MGKQSSRSIDLEALSQLRLPDSQGEPVELGSLWRDRPVALVFLRHFG